MPKDEMNRTPGLESIVLLMLDRAPAHGYDLAQRIREFYGFDVSDGTVYPTLLRLERAAKIEGTWQDGPSGRQRKVFRLTDRGRSSMERARRFWLSFAARMSALARSGGSIG